MHLKFDQLKHVYNDDNLNIICDKWMNPYFRFRFNKIYPHIKKYTQYFIKIRDVQLNC